MIISRSFYVPIERILQGGGVLLKSTCYTGFRLQDLAFKAYITSRNITNSTKNDKNKNMNLKTISNTSTYLIKGNNSTETPLSL